MNKYLLCRPQGGLNDMLCQIEKCCRYAEQTGRLVIIDTNYKNSDSFNDEFGSYFLSKQKKLLISINNLPSNIEELDVYPQCLKGKLNTYETVKKVPFEPYKELNSNETISFDFTKDYPQKLIVHHQLGGGKLSLFALLRLKLVDTIKDELLERLKFIGGRYTAIHIRHTDYLSDYESALKILREKPPQKLFVATDNQNVLLEIIQKLPETKIFSFSSNLSLDGNPIHLQQHNDQNINYKRNRDAIIDLMILAISTNLMLCKISTGVRADKKPTYSGFSYLANMLWENKIIISQLLSADKIRIGLD